MKLPFERLGAFVVWYVARDLPLVVAKSDLVKFIDEAPFDDANQSSRLKMAVFMGAGYSDEVSESAAIVTHEIERSINSNGWPYSYRFEGKKAVSAFEAYTSAFCFCNKNIASEEVRTSIDGHVSYKFFRCKLMRKVELISFSKDMVESVVGPSMEYFVGLAGGDYLYFGGESIKRLYSDLLEPVSERPDYYELLAASYSQR
ncbi:hypothetical protein [Marinobacter sp. SS8-8]|jgi:hypothetical protein|uniref:hypothetical protein n=1 Tax=Marinobacter sp. SS8-8 TaxID=3050452 RepID=UPI0025976161|nr:hypothetical protein [Marinobacter sp. SS8-8]|tara:strand:- start:433 stop:1038 length:606 start_codon:yes stop_codon:yes gene_type:complete